MRKIEADRSDAGRWGPYLGLQGCFSDELAGGKMNTSLFRKSALDRLSSPEDLDQALVEPLPRGSLLLIAVLAIIALAAVWSWFGSVPLLVEARGALARDAAAPLGVSAVVYAQEGDGYRIRSGDKGSLSLATLPGSGAARLPVTVRMVTLRPARREGLAGLWVPVTLEVGSAWIGPPPSNASQAMADGVPVTALLSLGNDRPLAILIPELTRNDDR